MRHFHLFGQRGSSRMWGRARKSILLALITGIFAVGCGTEITPTQNLQLQPTESLPSTITPGANISTDTPIPSPSVTPTLTQKLVWFPDYIPAKLRADIQLPDGYAQATAPDTADIMVEVGDQDSTASSQWIYALVAPFPTVTDGVTDNELNDTWEGAPIAAFANAPLLMDESTLEVLSLFWGNPAAGVVQVIDEDELLDYAWSNRPSWAIIPFEKVSPRWKVLTIDGSSPVRKDFDPAGYPLTIPFVLTGDTNLTPGEINIPNTNRDPSRLTTVAMTGVTALVRATAFAMENYGITYPAEDIGSLLAQADITHISNEIPFSPDCPHPQPISTSLVFCSDPKYIDLLKTIGTDVIELTGDHFMDYGAEATLFTLKMYDEQGWPYYGGGADNEKARRPVLFEDHGNKIAFMGCNVGCEVKTSIPCTAIATDIHPGAAQCDFDWISSEIPRLKQDGYQVIFSFQHIEYYKYTIEPILEKDFTRVAQAGAVIVSGSQAHQPHGFSFENNSYLHYGLGNLFFDQYHFCAYYACDDGFIDRHVFYDGRYISTELITIHFVDYARPRLMTPEERASFLETMFSASSW